MALHFVRFARSLALLSTAAVAACDPASSEPDAFAVDAHTVPPDSASADVGRVLDDAGVVDGGRATDTGTDARGVSDTGVASDTGRLADTGSDTGRLADAGGVQDAGSDAFDVCGTCTCGGGGDLPDCFTIGADSCCIAIGPLSPPDLAV